MLDCLLKYAIVVEDVGIPVDKLVVVGVLSHHFCIPLDAFFVFRVLVAAERETIIGRSLDYFCFTLLVIPLEDMPFVETHHLLVVTQSCDVVE